MTTVTLPRPDDWHLHVRDGDAMRGVLPMTAAHFGRALLMPNLKPPVTTVAEAAGYRERAESAVRGSHFTPYFSLYLTERTPVAEVAAVAADPSILGFKLYPAGATTHSEAGVRDLAAVRPVLEAMAAQGVPLLVHAEVTDPDVDVFDREAVFLHEVLGPALNATPGLRVVVEHVTTADAVAFVQGLPVGQVGATITPQHLLLDRNDLFRGGLRPHHYCLPILKRRDHRIALVKAATSGDPRFFLGTDSAPHARHAKEAACGCAGCFTAPHAMALYATAFARAGALDRLADFASRFGAAFYGLPPATGTLTLVNEAAEVPASHPFGDDEVVPLFAGEVIPWRVL
ncbi:MAG: dihydroorotase [Pseudomonadota bacterium]|jgi:dihydroorotase